MRALSAALAMVALAACLVAPAVPQASPASDRASDEAFRPSICTRALGVMSSVRVDTDGLAEDRLVIGTWEVRPRAWRWRGENRTHPTWNTVLHSSAWLIPDDSTGVPDAVDAMVEQSRVNPDSGRAPDMGVRGWTEAHVTKRLTTALCLYEWADTGTRQRLVPVIEALARANMDPRRYAGPPRRGPHNHGLMADRVLIDAARDLGRPGWEEVALQRISLQLRDTFDPCGMVFEQSSTYLLLHIRLWTGILRWLEEPQLSIAEDALKRARRMADALTRPDGGFEIVGDGGARARPSGGEGPLRWCPQTGWFANTWRASGLTQHTVVRFGPGTRGHGHADHGAMTWWVGHRDDSVVVLTDRGLFGKSRDARLDYARSAEAHSTLQGIVGPAKVMVGELRDGGRRVLLTGQGGAVGGPTARLDPPEGDRDRWLRQVRYDDAGAVLSVTDRIEGGEPRKVRQRFALDPAWRESGPGTFTAPGGWRLTIECSAGRPAVRDVPHFPDTGVVERALSADCTGMLGGTSPPMTAVLRVRPPSDKARGTD
ncbi:MAG: heparinase II/III family protein [bacterium]